MKLEIVLAMFALAVSATTLLYVVNDSNDQVCYLDGLDGERYSTDGLDGTAAVYEVDLLAQLELEQPTYRF